MMATLSMEMVVRLLAAGNAPGGRFSALSAAIVDRRVVVTVERTQSAMIAMPVRPIHAKMQFVSAQITIAVAMTTIAVRRGIAAVTEFALEGASSARYRGWFATRREEAASVQRERLAARGSASPSGMSARVWMTASVKMWMFAMGVKFVVMANVR